MTTPVPVEFRTLPDAPGAAPVKTVSGVRPVAGDRVILDAVYHEVVTVVIDYDAGRVLAFVKPAKDPAAKRGPIYHSA